MTRLPDVLEWEGHSADAAYEKASSGLTTMVIREAPEKVAPEQSLENLGRRGTVRWRMLEKVGGT